MATAAATRSPEARSTVSVVAEPNVTALSDDVTKTDLDDLFTVSPYLTLSHQIRLSTLDIVSRLVTLALSKMDPVDADYATTMYSKAFDWDAVFSMHLSSLVKQQSDLLETSWPDGTTKAYYVVQFRSILKEDANRELLGLLDQKSHEEASTSGGLLKYWFGSPSVNRQNLATCIWRSEHDAIEGGKGPWHKQARQSAAKLYESISFSRLWLNLRREGDGILWSFKDA